MSGNRGSFESIVSAVDADAAIEIAAEAVPKGAEVTKTDAADVSADYGRDSWKVTIKFRRSQPEGEI